MTTHTPRIRNRGVVSGLAVPTLFLSLILALALLPLGCSDDDGSPTAPVFLSGFSGTWEGSITGRSSAGGVTEPASLRLVLTVDEDRRIESGRYQVTYAGGEVEAGDVAGAVDHEVYLNEDGETCSWQARFQVRTRQRLEGTWFGWTCGAEGGEVALQRR